MKDMADSLVDLGLAKLGYEYLCVDGKHAAVGGKAFLAYGVCMMFMHCPQVQLATLEDLQSYSQEGLTTELLPQMPGQSQRGMIKGTLWPTRPHSRAE